MSGSFAESQQLLQKRIYILASFALILYATVKDFLLLSKKLPKDFFAEENLFCAEL